MEVLRTGGGGGDGDGDGAAEPFYDAREIAHGVETVVALYLGGDMRRVGIVE